RSGCTGASVGLRGPGPPPRDEALQGLPLCQLHGVVRCPALDPHGVYGDEVRMPERSCDLRLALEALEGPLIEDQARQEDLERDAPIARNLERLEDDPHTAPADLADDLELSVLQRGLGAIEDRANLVEYP